MKISASVSASLSQDYGEPSELKFLFKLGTAIGNVPVDLDLTLHLEICCVVVEKVIANYKF